MVVRPEDARIEVEIDTRRAVSEIDEIESQLERARARRRGPARIDPGRESRLGGRRLGAAAGLAAGRAVGGGLRRAVGFAAKVGFGLSLAEVIRLAPAVLPNLLDEDTLRTQVIPEIDIPTTRLPRIEFPAVDVFGRQIGPFELFSGKTFFEGTELEGRDVGEVLRAFGKKIAEIEGLLNTTVRAATLAWDLAAEGKITQGATEAIVAIRQAIQPSTQKGALGDETKGVGGPLGVGEETRAIFDAFRAYNTAEAQFRQYAVGARARQWVDNQVRGFRAAGGGVSR